MAQMDDILFGKGKREQFYKMVPNEEVSAALGLDAIVRSRARAVHGYSCIQPAAHGSEPPDWTGLAAAGAATVARFGQRRWPAPQPWSRWHPQPPLDAGLWAAGAVGELFAAGGQTRPGRALLWWTVVGRS